MESTVLKRESVCSFFICTVFCIKQNRKFVKKSIQYYVLYYGGTMCT